MKNELSAKTNEKTEAGKKMHCLHKVESLAILYSVQCNECTVGVYYSV